MLKTFLVKIKKDHNFLSSLGSYGSIFNLNERSNYYIFSIDVLASKSDQFEYLIDHDINVIDYKKYKENEVITIEDTKTNTFQEFYKNAEKDFNKTFTKKNIAINCIIALLLWRLLNV